MLRLFFSLLFLISFNSLAHQPCEQIAVIDGSGAAFKYQNGTVATDKRVYFYSAPNNECQLQTFIINNDNVEIFRDMLDEYGKRWFYIRYRNQDEVFFTGWVKAEYFITSHTGLEISSKCQHIKSELDNSFRLPGQNNQYTVVGDGRAYFYSAPDENCKSVNVFLIPGDSVSAQETSEDKFILVNYYTSEGNIIRGWLKNARLENNHHGDIYRNDISPLDVDLAVRVVSLWLSTENKCFFYDVANDDSIYRLLVREDHSSVNCRSAAADPETSPVVAWFDIDKKTGEVNFDGINALLN